MQTVTHNIVSSPKLFMYTSTKLLKHAKKAYLIYVLQCTECHCQRSRSVWL